MLLLLLLLCYCGLCFWLDLHNNKNYNNNNNSPFEAGFIHQCGLESLTLFLRQQAIIAFNCVRSIYTVCIDVIIIIVS